MTTIRQLQRLSPDAKATICADIEAQVTGWYNQDEPRYPVRIEYVGRGVFEFTDESNERDYMAAYHCSCGEIFATWEDMGELDFCPGCNASVYDFLVYRVF